MLVYGVEGDRSAASLVKDSKVYIEIAKFVEAYTTITQNPNEFLAEVDEEPINPETDILSWAQLVKILTTCDLGFDPVPTEKQLVSYYTYARQIGSISKDVKPIATVSDVAEAQKHFYNFIDEETEKVTTMYNKQHEIAENRAKEVQVIDNNLKKKKTKNALYFFGMMVSVFCIMLGVASAAFDLLGFNSNIRYIFGAIFILIGICLFYVFDKLYTKAKRDYFGYHKSTRDTVSRSEKTNLDEKVLKDKLAKYERDLKVAKFELADKEKRFDVEKNIAVLKERNRYYRMLRDRDPNHEFGGFGRRRRMALINELEEANQESLFSIFGNDRKHMSKQPKKSLLEEVSDLFRASNNENGIDVKNRANKSSVMGMIDPLAQIPKMRNHLKPIDFNHKFRGGHELMERPIGRDIMERNFGSNMRNIRSRLPNDFLLEMENRVAHDSTRKNEYRHTYDKFIRRYPELDIGRIISRNGVQLKLNAESLKENLDLSNGLDLKKYSSSLGSGIPLDILENGRSKTQDNVNQRLKANNRKLDTAVQENNVRKITEQEEQKKKAMKELENMGGRSM